MASLIETSEFNAIDQNACPCSTLKAITDRQPESQINDRLPWAFANAPSR